MLLGARFVAFIVLVVLLGILLVGFLSERGEPEGTVPETVSSITSPITSPLEEASASGIQYVKVSPGYPVEALAFIRDRLLFINVTAEANVSGVVYRTLSLHVMDLNSLRVEFTIGLEEVPVQPTESLPCRREGLLGAKAFTPVYAIMGYDGRYVYYSRYCPSVVDGRNIRDYPMLYVVDTLRSRVYESDLNSYAVMALRGGVAYMYSDGVISAVDVIGDSVLWSHNYTPGYVFEGPWGQRLFAGTVKAAWLDGETLGLLLVDSQVHQDSYKYVYGLVLASPEGVREYYIEAFSLDGVSLLKHDIQVAPGPGGLLYVLASLEYRTGEGEARGKLYLHAISGDGSVSWVIERDMAAGKAQATLHISDTAVGIRYMPPSGVSVFEEINPNGETLGILRPEGPIVGYWDGVVYTLKNGRYLLRYERGATEPTVLTDLGPRGPGIGLVITLPMLMPFLPFLERPSDVVYMTPDALYLYKARDGILAVVRVDAS